MKCEECIHREVCKLRGYGIRGAKCPHGKSEKLYINLPCALGETVYAIAAPCSGCENYTKPMTEDILSECEKCERMEVIELEFDYDLIGEFGKTVFKEKKEAQRKAEEKKNESV